MLSDFIFNHHYKHVRVILCHKNFAVQKGISHIGLGVAALNTVSTLLENGIKAEVWAASSAHELKHRIIRDNIYHQERHKQKITHVVVSAPWIPTLQLESLLVEFPNIKFVVVSHSNIGFLMADTNGIRLLKEAVDLSSRYDNLYVGGNSLKFVEWARVCWSSDFKYLPNLYYLDFSDCEPEYSDNILRIGCFGAARPLKNAITAAASAIQLGKVLERPVEFWMNCGRDCGGPQSTTATQQLLQGQPNVELKFLPWCSWLDFRKFLRNMNLLMQVSYTESFNMVTADGIIEGVPTVVSTAISWAPKSWKADSDDANDVTRIGMKLIDSEYQIKLGKKHLKEFVYNGINAWKSFLNLI